MRHFVNLLWPILTYFGIFTTMLRFEAVYGGLMDFFEAMNLEDSIRFGQSMVQLASYIGFYAMIRIFVTRLLSFFDGKITTWTTQGALMRELFILIVTVAAYIIMRRWAPVLFHLSRGESFPLIVQGIRYNDVERMVSGFGNEALTSVFGVLDNLGLGVGLVSFANFVNALIS